MHHKTLRFGWFGFWLLALTVGCASRSTEHPAAGEDNTVRAQFAALQAAVKAGDADKLWTLMDSKSQADAEQAAKAIQAAYAKAGAEVKAKQEETLGLPAGELSGLTGKGFLKTKRFPAKYRELPESTIEKVTVEGANATVYYLESDGDKEKLIFVRQDGQWKVWLALPKVGTP
jgi:hypothetical protein